MELCVSSPKAELPSALQGLLEAHTQPILSQFILLAQHGSKSPSPVPLSLLTGASPLVSLTLLLFSVGLTYIKQVTAVQGALLWRRQNSRVTGTGL